MKIINSLFLFLGILLVQACNDKATFPNFDETNDISSRKLSNVNIDKITSIRELKSEDQKVAFELLSQNERYTLWYNQLEAHLKMEKYNDKQKEFIKELLGGLTDDIFSPIEKNDAKHIYHAKIFKPWVERAAKEFAPRDLDNLVFSINSQSELEQFSSETPLASINTTVSGDYMIKAQAADCECNVGSSFTCLTYYASCDCHVYLECVRHPCSNQTTSGCGAFLMYSCNGVCDPFSWGE